MNRLAGKTAIITGASNGIGATTAELFCAEGCEVAIVDIDVDNGQKVLEGLLDSGANAKFYKADIRNEDDVKGAFDAIYNDFGKIDILINNAGVVGVNKDIADITESEFEECWQVDVKGLFLCSKHAIPYLRKNGKGSIVNISSICGLVSSSAGLFPYHSAKGAVTNMTRNMAIALAPDNIRVNAINPGTTLTPLIIELGSRGEGGLEGYKKRLGVKHPLGLGMPIQVAYGILYMASDESSWTTGAILPIDGGFTAQ